MTAEHTLADGLAASSQPVDDVLAEIAEMRVDDLDWRGGRAFSLVYNSDDADLARLEHSVADSFLHENALNPLRYRTLLRMEIELIEAAQRLLGGTAGSGSLSSGGTESIFLAVYTAREWARERGIERPRIVTAETAHPAFAKACHYLDVDQTRVSLGGDGRVDVDAVLAAVDAATCLLVASAPCYPYGVVDPVADIAAAAQERDLLCHVDACLGGWLLPFWERIGRPVEPWDFRVEGVTSISADIHKYGYVFKGVSTIQYRDPAMAKRQLFWFEDWPGGLYASQTTAGTRPAPPIAAAWAVLSHLGYEGYERLARRVATATDGFLAAIAAVDGLAVTYPPDMSVFEFGPEEGSEVDIVAVADHMDATGWALDRQPGGLHVMLSPGHDRAVNQFAADLADAVANGTRSGAAAVPYASVPGSNPGSAASG